MTANDDILIRTKENYREMVNQMGKKEFTLLKMQEYGFWPKDLPTPYERQKSETQAEYTKRKELLNEYQKLINAIGKLYEDKEEISKKLRELKRTYDKTWDYEKIRTDISKKIMEESIKRRKERKAQKELEKQQRHEVWQQKKSEQIIFIGKGYSQLLHQKESDNEKLSAQGLPIINNDKALAELLGISYETLRFLAYHRDVVTVDHYHRYSVPKKRGGHRNIAAPKPELKAAQRKILEEILVKISASDDAHGFLKGKSVVSGADTHLKSPELLINLDLENFFPSITFERVRGMFKGLGYSGYIASLLAMLCTYCERMPIEVKEEVKYVKTTDRILPQGSPASPMITNILCRQMDKRLHGAAAKFGFVYTRYADDMSFSINTDMKMQSAGEIESASQCLEHGKFLGIVSKIVCEEGFKINQAKTKFLRKNNRQSVTGIVINNEQIGVPKKWVKRLRAAVYNAKKQKMAASLSQHTVSEIKGMAAWLRSVNAERYKVLIDEAMQVINES